jgi:hypothetical protein
MDVSPDVVIRTSSGSPPQTTSYSTEFHYGTAGVLPQRSTSWSSNYGFGASGAGWKPVPPKSQTGDRIVIGGAGIVLLLALAGAMTWRHRNR